MKGYISDFVFAVVVFNLFFYLAGVLFTMDFNFFHWGIFSFWYGVLAFGVVESLFFYMAFLFSRDRG